MTEGQSVKRLSKVANEFNISIARIVEFLAKKGYTIDSNPNAKISIELFEILDKEFKAEKTVKEAATKINIDITKRETVSLEEPKVQKTAEKEEFQREEEKKPSEIFIKNDKTAAEDLKPKKAAEAKVTPKHEKTEETVVKAKEEKTKVKAEEEQKTEVVKTTSKKAAKIEEEPVKKTEKVEEDVEETAKDDNKIKLTKVGKINLDDINQRTKPDKKSRKKATKAEEIKEEEEKAAIKEKAKKAKSKKEKEVAEAEEKIEGTKETEAVIEPETTEKLEITEEIVAEIKKEDEVDEVPEETPEITTEENPTAETEVPDNFIKTQYTKLDGPVIKGKMELPVYKETTKKEREQIREKEREKRREVEKEKLKERRKESQKIADNDKVKAIAPTSQPGVQRNTAQGDDFKKKRKRIEQKVNLTNAQPTQDKFNKFKPKDNKFGKPFPKPEVKEEDIAKQIKETLARLSSSGKTKASKHRKQKRDQYTKQKQEDNLRSEEDKKTIQVTEFVTANELASLMNVTINEIISMCLNLGIFVSINQRLDAETLSIVAEEFGYKVEFVTIDLIENIKVEEENEEDRIDRAPIVTVMGHVDHGKTSLLDYIRKTNVIAGEAGGITQHIGAYEVTLESGKKITFLDTPGHEAFTAMRARGTKITDVVIIIIAADEDVMPQTKEAINHASAAGVPIVFAINKIDKPNANIDKIKEGLAKLNYLVEDWGGKYQYQDISSKKGTNVDLLLDKVLLEAELLELKANPNKRAVGSVIESSLDKGKGYVAKIMVQDGTLRIGDILVAGHCYGRVKAMYNERNLTIKEAGPSTPLLLLGLNGAPQAGDTFNVFVSESEAKEVATKRLQLQREQNIRTQKHITLDEIGRRIAIGDFKQLNIIVKGDVDGSIEALSDSLLKLSTQQVQVNVIHKSVGQITESDILLASASDAVVIGFQVRPSPAARKLALQEQIDIRLYSIIYNAINELKSAIEGMLSPEIIEKTTSNLEVKDVFDITKVGTIAGCQVLEGKLTNKTKIHVIRDGIVIHTGELSSLRHFKDETKEVKAGQECGISIKNFNDIKVKDIIEGFEEIEVKRKLS